MAPLVSSYPFNIIKIILEDNKHRPVMKAEIRKKIPRPLIDNAGE
jgi:hypothetical protein